MNSLHLTKVSTLSLLIPIKGIPQHIPSNEICTLVTLTPQKADYILELIETFSRFASLNIGAYCLSVYDNSAKFIYTESLSIKEPLSECLIIKPHQSIHAVEADVDQIMIEVLDGAVIWKAQSIDGSFQIESSELPRSTLEKIAWGLPLQPEPKSTDFNDNKELHIFVKDPFWMHKVM
jgi:hypothetical protein